MLWDQEAEHTPLPRAESELLSSTESPARPNNDFFERLTTRFLPALPHKAFPDYKRLLCTRSVMHVTSGSLPGSASHPLCSTRQPRYAGSRGAFSPTLFPSDFELSVTSSSLPAPLSDESLLIPYTSVSYFFYMLSKSVCVSLSYFFSFPLFSILESPRWC